MHRNLSESQLVQAGSKAVSNVAEQFSKLGQTFNPRILTGRKASDASISSKEPSFDQSLDDKPNEMYAAAAVVADESIGVTIGADGDSVCGDNSFLKSVGIVMVDAGKLDESPTDMSEPRKPKVLLKNLSKMSITSVTDNVNMPQEMLDIGDAMIATDRATTPSINVQETDDGKLAVTGDGMKMCHSVSDIRSDPAYAIDESR